MKKPRVLAASLLVAAAALSAPARAQVWGYVDA